MTITTENLSSGQPLNGIPAIEAGDGRRIELSLWQNEHPPRAIVQILHGLAEHVQRYERFATACNARGFTVVGHDHRGHGGQSAEGADAALGHFADTDGWSKVVDDTHAVLREIKRRYPETPLILFGHSMGSYIAQSFVMRDSPDIDALILSGSTWPNKQELSIARLLARVMKWFRGTRTPSRLFDEMLFKKYNQRFAPNRTAFDWLSRDESEVDRYVTDPLCGSRSTNGLWQELFGALLEISAARALVKVPASLPILITGGALDPVGGAKALSRLAAEYEASGHVNVTLKLYAEGRHEMLNEINREEVTNDILTWIDGAIA